MAQLVKKARLLSVSGRACCILLREVVQHLQAHAAENSLVLRPDSLQKQAVRFIQTGNKLCMHGACFFGWKQLLAALVARDRAALEQACGLHAYLYTGG